MMFFTVSPFISALPLIVGVSVFASGTTGSTLVDEIPTPGVSAQLGSAFALAASCSFLVFSNSLWNSLPAFLLCRLALGELY
jgi:hypothetical protein